MMDRLLTALPLVPLTALAVVMAWRHASRGRELLMRRKEMPADTAAQSGQSSKLP